MGAGQSGRHDALSFVVGFASMSSAKISIESDAL
jgi:hypothetical protein